MDDLERIVAKHSKGSAKTEVALSFHALKRARTTLEDFAKTYFPFHGVSSMNFFKYLPLLVFVEGMIYRMDEENEELAKLGIFSGEQKEEMTELHGETVLREVLQAEGHWTQAIEKEINAGKRYWQQERQLCSRVLHELPISIEEVFACSEAKSFDYRVLHHLLLQLLGIPPNAEVFEFMFFNEHLVDIQDDLFDFEKDVAQNSFNIYRMLLYCLGKKEAQATLIERVGNFERKQSEAFQKLSAPQQKAFQQRESEAKAEFGAGSDRWVFPTLPEGLLAEESHAEETSNNKRPKLS